ncbi:hypothetical protein ENUP19_0306G0012 [Entamoeba nuttalli]|uniref:Uncharacterized protein n=2 Tax=Entamoeba nuttalli TaxID=412467 RepID=K2HXG7_ENTNP|nr:hypothetical protein ENU1_070070 [Entamoeba nuttalli P19]EKE41040.1 hypothetical protein ENU1_070070 [Entamoeba nuttalli P19]|eukprot:XP_008856630.1 hypothetical protein ENU1_070070 [Entamoeba nuttalli P19]
MSSKELRQRQIMENNYREIQEIEKIEEKDQKTSNIFRRVALVFALILFILKFIISLRTLFVNGFGGEEFCSNDIHYVLSSIKNGYIVFLLEFISSLLFLWCICIFPKFYFILEYISYKSMLWICAGLTVSLMLFTTVLAGLWLFGLNTIVVGIYFYADYLIRSVTGDVQNFLNEHKYQA